MWKRRKIGDYFGYVCTTHLDDKDACTLKFIREDIIMAAFATMMNKLIFARDKVLLPFSNVLETAEKAEYMDEFTALEERLEKNLQKWQQITQLLTKGYLDPAVYAQQNNELMSASARLTAEKDAIIAKISGGSRQNKSLEGIFHYTSRASMLTEFDEALFTRFVDRVIVYSRTELGFDMKFGPVFRKRI